MNLKSMRKRLLQASGLGAVAVTATLALTTGVSSAITLPSPAVGPLWQTGTVQTVRGSGSDTTFFLSQKMSDLYNQAALYGCVLQADNATCNQTGDLSTTNTVDNYDRTEVSQGIDAVGSGAGQGQLCGTTALPANLKVDYARSSKPAGTACNDLVGQGFAKDGVPAVDFQTAIPGDVGTSTAFASVNGGNLGPVAAGWIPGDAVDGPYTGTAFSNLTNNDSGGGLSSVAYRLYCSTSGTRITDWGQLTNLSASGPGNGGVAKTVGNGAAIGIPINIIGVNSASGTESTFDGFVASGQAGCATTNTNAESHALALLENNTSQLADVAAAVYPASATDQVEYLSASLYYEANGVYATNPYAKSVTVGANTYVATKLKENGVASTSVTNLNNTFPTARTLYNIYRTGTIRASTAAWLNWWCDSNNVFTKGKDLGTGLNYDAEITTLINTSFGFSRLTNTSAAPNNSCQLIAAVHDPAS